MNNNNNETEPVLTAESLDTQRQTPLPSTEEEKIEIVIKSQGNLPELRFRTKTTCPFQKMFDTYHSRSNSQPGSIRFIYEGQRLDTTQTPKDLDMQSEDIIDAVIQQVGGHLSHSTP